jgi:hypothetical protein
VNARDFDCCSGVSRPNITDDDMATLRRLITQELEMWDRREPQPMTYAQGVRDGLQAALTYMDSIEGGGARG